MTSSATPYHLAWQWAPAIVLAALLAFFTAVNPNFLSVANLARMSISAPASRRW